MQLDQTIGVELGLEVEQLRLMHRHLYRGRASEVLLMPENSAPKPGLRSLDRPTDPSPQRQGRNSESDDGATSRLRAWKADLAQQEVALSRPRFKVRWTSNLVDALKVLGMIRAFDGGLAQFPAFRATDNVSISRVLHEAVLEVDEEGAEAAAATIVETMERGLPAGPVEMRVDRPFLLAIVDESSGAILFAGALSNPQ